MKRHLVSVLLASVLLGAGCTYGIVERHAPAEVAFLRGRYSEALSLVEAGRTHPTTSLTGRVVIRCESYARLKDYTKLFECLDELEGRVAGGGDGPWTWTFDRWDIPQLWGWRRRDMSAMPHLLRAEAFIELGRYREAIEQASRADAVARERGLQVGFRIHALSLLSLARALQGDRPAALRDAALLDGVSTAFLENQKLTGLARTYMALGQFDKSLAAVRRIGPDRFQSFADWVTTASARGESLFTWWTLPREYVLARSLHETGHTREARDIYDRLLRHPATADNGDIYWVLLFDRGRVAESEGDPASARDLYVKAIDVIERQRSSINTAASKIGYAGDKQEAYARLIALLVADGARPRAFEYAERARSRALVDLLAAKKNFAVASGASREIRSALAQLEVAEAASRAEGSSTPDPDAGRRGIAMRELHDTIGRLGPELTSLVTVTSLRAAEIQRELGADEVLLEYYVHGTALHAFVVTRDALDVVTLDGVGLAEDVAAFRTAVQNPRSTDVGRLSRSLFERLVRPVAGLLTGARLTVVPYGVLHYLPFNALHGGEAYLIERYSVRYLPSASVLRYLPARDGRAVRRLLALGDPDVAGRRLPDAAREARAVAEGFAASSTVLVGSEATEAAFRRLAPGHSHLHLAAHGRFDSAAPLTSGLLLARDREHDGVLTVDEIFSLRLDADLVTLSACETGLGTLNPGDDVIGLTRGLLYAGARAVVASLWKVDDEATLELMTEFYRRLVAVDAVDALRAAQLAVHREHDHPFYWAAFQLTGHPR